ncbi:MAG: 50S ribosomal protein L39e [Candidatus Nanoarchaeia archaeon]|nr:50S ribosomal protein L39e [Candidatus Haiyanarchaeum thermophilum]MCW1302791.1 50S ribosomal protein L39e [Candidatus Haiyanarchaeum thermophilum]MCW1304111.1 50S ribosomal protein L39e [Candidatus Haiyanarchaeum thermophilum]MCW1306652.1 50S ribosomal protein L39e [Candidatus Haiyanarchaeum thermophilum]MCW1307392.1 50S ribosomal protein L39e [Candidatus Haiyanarchaeum thermophilum]
MAKQKPKARKKRLIRALRSARPAPAWALLKAFGKRRIWRWALNPHERRSWRSRKLKL